MIVIIKESSFFNDLLCSIMSCYVYLDCSPFHIKQWNVAAEIINYLVETTGLPCFLPSKCLTDLM